MVDEREPQVCSGGGGMTGEIECRYYPDFSPKNSVESDYLL